MKITLYSTNCPRCNVLERKLRQKELEYEKIDNFDVQPLIDKGFRSAPVLVVDDNWMNYMQAIEYLKGV